jgi:hypothetical protein
MNFRFFIFLPFLMARRAAHGAARIAAALAKGAVRAWILLRRLLIHEYILQPLTRKKLVRLSETREAGKCERLPYRVFELFPQYHLKELPEFLP